MISLLGKAQNIESPIVGIVTTKAKNILSRKNQILVLPKMQNPAHGYACIVTEELVESGTRARLVHSVNSLQSMTDGDIVLITPSGQINIMYQGDHEDHTVFITNRCNSRCIMCPQPPQSDPPDLPEINMQILSLIKDGSLKHVGITGGEPTLVLDQLCAVLSVLQKRFPEAIVSVLTNGRKMNGSNIVRQVVSSKNKKILFCIPLYADNDIQHDKIVGVSGAFQDTIRGVYNLFRFGCKIEIRIVVMKQNFKRLPALAEFIYRNLPFVSHIAFMGMEYTGEAEQNLDDLWIDPTEYQEKLYDAVWHTHRRSMNVSIYNTPLCLLDERLWQFARDSISQWKKNYLPQCDGCQVKDKCSGIFTTSSIQSKNIFPVDINDRVL